MDRAVKSAITGTVATAVGAVAVDPLTKALRSGLRSVGIGKKRRRRSTRKRRRR